MAHLSFLIAYFRISGFVVLDELLRQSGGYGRFKRIRILVGMDVDSLLCELAQNGLEFTHQGARFKSAFIALQRGFLQNGDYTQEGEESFEKLREALCEKRLEMRVIKGKTTHAKFYIFAHENAQNYTNPSLPHIRGSLIVGSSNLTQNGLEKHYEVNLVSRDESDIYAASAEFERLWREAVEISPEDIAKITQNSHLDADNPLSPRDIYYKLLLCHFGEVFEGGDPEIAALFGDYKPHEYQIHAILEGVKKLERFGGFFLSDVVGLGKTLIAAVIARHCLMRGIIKGEVLVVCPPALKEAWDEHFRNIGIAKRTIITHDSLQNLENCEKYELVIVDESHKFRNRATNRYGHLSRICQTPFCAQNSGANLANLANPKTPANLANLRTNPANFAKKKVILLSATPQNNSPKDIAAQTYLFLDKIRPNIDGIGNLEQFFSPLIKEYEGVKSALKSNEPDKRKNARTTIKKLSKTLRDRLLSHIMIRRTRGDIEALYKGDMEKQGLNFPAILPPKDLLYDLDSASHNLATETIKFLSQDKSEFAAKFHYARYLIFPSLTQRGQEKFMDYYEEAGEDGRAWCSNTAERLQVLMQMILFKRFDSSIEAFKSTLNNQIRSCAAFIAMFERGAIYLPTKDFLQREALYEAALSEDEGALENLLSGGKGQKVIELAPSDFKGDFLGRLKSDHAALTELLARWENFKGDPKFDRLLAFLDEHKNQKIIIFSESVVSAEHLWQRLEAGAGQRRILCVTAKNREQKEREMVKNFDANYAQKRDDYDILIATDTLAEGVNLHRANIILNYDTPYNATRLMQRIGRINRIGTDFSEIFIHNFKPTKIADDIIGINAMAFQKLQSFHYTLGEDSAIYDESEEFGSVNLGGDSEALKEEESPDTRYLLDLQELFKNRAELEKIKNLPPRSRAIIAGKSCESYGYIAAKINAAPRNGESAAANLANPVNLAAANAANNGGCEYFYPYHITPNRELFGESCAAKPCDFYEMADFLREHINEAPLKTRDLALHYAHINAALRQFEEDRKPKALEICHTPAQAKALAKISSANLREETKADLKSIISNDTLVRRVNGVLAKDSRDCGEKLAQIAAEFAPQIAAQKPQNLPPSQPPLLPNIELSVTVLDWRAK